MESRIRALAVVLAAFSSGCLCQTSAQSTTPTAKKTLGSAISSPSADDNKAAFGTPAATAEAASASPKPAVPASSPPTADAKAPQGQAVAATQGKTPGSYVVGIADGLFITVWKEPDFSGPVVVRPDGMITVPVVGDVRVAGLTTKQVQDLLTEKLQSVVTEPQVTVVVREIRSRKVYLVGKVGHPGSVSLAGHETVLQVLAEAGGPTQFSKPQKMYILRTNGDSQKRIQFNYKKVLAGSEPDLELIVGDVIVVP